MADGDAAPDPHSAEHTLERLSIAACDCYRDKHGADPQWMVAAPGRVNLIGEHTDYNDGFVLPMALDRNVVIAAGPSESDGQALLWSVNVDEAATVVLSPNVKPGPSHWSSYVQGVIVGCLARGWSVSPFQAVIDSSVPVGGGLSSSAALEVATATLLEAISGRMLDPIEKALLCQKAEHEFAGVPCGIMDQFSSVLCEKDKLMLLDCRSQEVTLVPFDDPDVVVVIANTNVKHELTGGEYAQRRRECEQAAQKLGVPSLRDATADQLSASRSRLSEIEYRRARHVIGEIQRTVEAAAALKQNDWANVGQLMYASHESLRDDYEVSCPELDLMVDIARRIGESGGVIGSRMTGGGFGGCTVSLVRRNHVPQVVRDLTEQYQSATQIEPAIFATRPSQGAQVLKSPSCP